MAKKGKQILTRQKQNTTPKIQNAKTKKKINSQLYKDVRSNLNLHEWPYYKSFITSDELNQLLTKFKQINFKYSSAPYKPITFNRKTPILPATYKGEYIKFIDDNYLKYDIIPLIYSEPELLKCQFRRNPPALTYFKQHHTQLATEFLKQHTPQTAAEYREFLFSKVKQCNNFRPTLALHAYNFLDDRNLIITEKQAPQAILDFSAGWGDRLFAACISDKKYIGLDPNTNNTHIYNDIIKNHGKPNMQKVIATGAEYISIADLKIHMTSLAIKQFDLIFTSPPYFDYEIYATTTQSISNYATSSSTGFNKWLTYFLFNVIMRYVPLLRDKGYIGIYIQDTDKNNYLEPIGLFALAFAEQLGLTVCGIISSTRFPFIVLQKVGTRNVLPYKNPDNNKQFNKASINGLFRKQYPVIYQLCERLLRLNKYGMLTAVLTSNAPVIQHHKNIIKRAFEKVFMQLDINTDTVYIDDAFLEASIPSTLNSKPTPGGREFGVTPISVEIPFGANNSMSVQTVPPIQEFKRILDHFKIKLLSLSNLITVSVQNAKKVVRGVYLEIHQPLPEKYKMISTIAFKPILLNTVDEWLLLNKKKTGDIIISELFNLLLVP